METKEKRFNVDGEEIDLEKDDLMDKLTFESANLIRRFFALLIDYIILIVIWYLSTKYVYRDMDRVVEGLGLGADDFVDPESYQNFVKEYTGFILKLVIYWVFIKSAYFSLIPAIIGKGRTVGKMLAGIGSLDFKTLEEIKPLKLIFKEFIIRGIVETLLIIPGIVSCFIALFRSDSRSLHDLIAGTVVIKLDLYDIE